jgi:peptidyl-prolyl cis-trans isomerase B (cyclophilin B)
VLELYTDTAPVNVNSFAFLAGKGWYKGVTFHRVLPGFVAQGGDPTGLGIGFPGYRCGDEVDPARTFDGPGVVSFAPALPSLVMSSKGWMWPKKSLRATRKLHRTPLLVIKL